MSHNQMILEHLRKRGSISSAEAYRKYGCTRLAARIADLKKKNIAIDSEYVTGFRADGTEVRYKRYYLVDEEEELVNG